MAVTIHPTLRLPKVIRQKRPVRQVQESADSGEEFRYRAHAIPNDAGPSRTTYYQ